MSDIDELQDKLHELHNEHHAEGDTVTANWIKTISLTTALLAVFAALGELNSGRLETEATLSQIKASDTWNEYQSSSLKGHLYILELNGIVDAGIRPGKLAKGDRFTPKDKSTRAAEYAAQVDKEATKGKKLSEDAKRLEEQSERVLHRHHLFAIEVALVQVAIALGAISALTKVKPVWYMSMAIGSVGLVYFFLGLQK